MRIHFITTNRAGFYRIEQLHGREHYVVPLAILREGVLNGSKGTLFYPMTEISANYADWNGMPITVYHPFRNGRGVSARSAEILDSQSIGTVLNTRPKNNKLLAEGWIDVEKARRVDNRIIDALEKGEKMELSTGLYTDEEPSKNNANYNGKGYAFVARNYRPDHLAFLPDQKGACSLDDGCGVGVTNRTAPQSSPQEIIAAFNNCGTGSGGFKSGNSCSGGGSGGGNGKNGGKKGGKSKKGGKNSKITIQQAAKQLAAKGMKLGLGRTDLKAKKTYYIVTDKSGKKREMSTDEILATLKGGTSQPGITRPGVRPPARTRPAATRPGSSAYKAKRAAFMAKRRGSQTPAKRAAFMAKRKSIHNALQIIAASND